VFLLGNLLLSNLILKYGKHNTHSTYFGIVTGDGAGKTEEIKQNWLGHTLIRCNEFHLRFTTFTTEKVVSNWEQRISTK